MSEQTQIPTFSIAGHVPAPVAIEFADGVRQVPGAVAAELGGADELIKTAPALKQITYDAFMRAYGDDRAGRAVRGAIGQVVSQHMRMFGL
jgi:hypothetical protein